MDKSFIIAVFVLCTIATVNSLQCYQCDDCPSVLNEAYLVTCGENVNPDTGNNTNPDNPNNGTEINPDNTNNGTDINPDNTNNGTDTNPDITNNGTNPVNPNNGTDTNPDNPNNGTDINPDNTNNGTDTNPDNPNNGTDTNPLNPNNGTDTNPDNTNNGTDINPDNTNNGTDTNPDNPSNGTGTNPDNPNNGTAKHVLQVRRSADLDIDANKACLCYGMECSCEKEGAVPRAVNFENTRWVCGSATFKQNGVEHKYKRCVAEKVNDQDFCTWLKNTTAVESESGTEVANNTTELTECDTCTTDKCNGSADDNEASSIHSSALVAIVTLVTIIYVSN